MLDDHDDPGEAGRFLRSLATSAVSRRGIGAFDGATRARAHQAGLIAPNTALREARPAEAPWDVDPDAFREDIAAELDGPRLLLSLQVVTPCCSPLADARVDITQAVPGLSGSQLTDARGVARFRTLLPEPGRDGAVEIAYRIFPGEGTQVTGRLRLPAALLAPRDDGAMPNAAIPDQAGGAAEDGDMAHAAHEDGADGPAVALVVGVEDLGMAAIQACMAQHQSGSPARTRRRV